MLETLIAGGGFGFLLVFARIGAGLMVLPGIGDAFVPPRVRLLLALLLSLLVAPVVADQLPGLPTSLWALLVLLVGEIIIGLFIGLLSRLLLTAFEIAGMVISFNLSLANAFVFNPAAATQGSLVGAFLLMVALVLIFVTDLHHLMLLSLTDSYDLFRIGELPPLGDMADMVARLVAEAFTIALRIAAPFIVVGMVFHLGLGLIARLMPQMMIFFVAIPVQLMLGLAILALVISAMMLFWLGHFEERLVGFLAPA